MENSINSYWMQQQQQQQQPTMLDSYIPTVPVDQLLLGDSTYLSQVQQQQQAQYYNQLIQYQYNLWLIEQLRLQQWAWFQQQLLEQQQQKSSVANISEPQEEEQPFLKHVEDLLCEIDDKLKVANGPNNPQEFSFFSYNTKDVNAFTSAFKNYGPVDEAQKEAAGKVLIAEEDLYKSMVPIHDEEAIKDAAPHWFPVNLVQKEDADEVLNIEEDMFTYKVCIPNSDASKCTDTVELQQGCNDLDACDVQRYIGNTDELFKMK